MARADARAGNESGVTPLDPREVVLNALAACSPVRDPLRLLRDRRPPDLERLVEIALASLATRREFLGDERIHGASILEIGSGRDACLALLFLAMGARRVVNVEIDPFGFVDDARLYQMLVERAVQAGVRMSWPPEGLVGAADGGRVRLDPSRIVLELGRSAVSIPEPDASFDVTLSLAVLEHVRPADMPPVAGELYRLMRPGAMGCHRIDLVDHYTRTTEPFRFLKFSDREYRLMYGNRGSSSNRLRVDDFERIFRAAGFADVRVEEVHRHEDAAQFERWRQSFHADFRERDPEMLRAKDCLLVIRC
jgi:hypothetical protein